MLHTLFSHAELYQNGKLFSLSTNCYLHSASIETELTTESEAKDLCAKCQEYNYLAKSRKQLDLHNAIYAEYCQQKDCHGVLWGRAH